MGASRCQVFEELQDRETRVEHEAEAGKGEGVVRGRELKDEHNVEDQLHAREDYRVVAYEIQGDLIELVVVEVAV